MMPDIVVRLRGEGGAVDIPEIMHEAASEIEYLRSALDVISAGSSAWRTKYLALRAGNPFDDVISEHRANQ